MTALHQSAMIGSLQAIALLLKRGANVNALTHVCITPSTAASALCSLLSAVCFLPSAFCFLLTADACFACAAMNRRICVVCTTVGRLCTLPPTTGIWGVCGICIRRAPLSICPLMYFASLLPRPSLCPLSAADGIWFCVLRCAIDGLWIVDCGLHGNRRVRRRLRWRPRAVGGTW
jgi:hypothetical protein